MGNKEHVNPQASPQNWTLLFQFSSFFVLLGLAFNQSTASLFTRWIKWDEDLSHAIPTLLALLFLVFRVEKFPFSPDSKPVRTILITIIALLSVTWLLFVIANITFLANFTLLICIPLMLAACYSIRTTIFFVPVLGLLIFTLPIFSQLNNVLVLLSAHVVGFLVQLVGITALIDGQNIFITHGHIFIADGCSGLRYLTISILLGYMLAVLNHYSLTKTIVTLLVAIVLGLATNWLRIFLLVLIGDVTEMRSSLMHDHELFGWILFSCVMLPAIFFAPINKRKEISAPIRPVVRPFAPLLALILGPVILGLTPNTTGDNKLLSLKTSGLTSQSKPTDSLFPSRLPPTPFKEYASNTINESDLHMELTQYRPETLREKIIPYFESLYNPEEWQKDADATSSELKESGYKALRLRRTGSQTYALFIYRFEVGEHNTNHYEVAKLLQIPATFTGKRYLNIVNIHSLCNEPSCSSELTSATQLALRWDAATKTLR